MSVPGAVPAESVRSAPVPAVSGRKPNRRKRRTKAELERARKRTESSRRYYLRVNHNMSLEEYDAILGFQGGVCFICERAKGINRKLAVDHDHNIAREQCDHEVAKSCRRCWRGLCCSRCNNMLGHLRDEIAAFVRAARYLRHPPAQLWQKGGDIAREGH